MTERLVVYYITQETDELCFTFFDFSSDAKVIGSIDLCSSSLQPNGGRVYVATVYTARGIEESLNESDGMYSSLEGLYIPDTTPLGDVGLIDCFKEWAKFTFKADVVVPV